MNTLAVCVCLALASAIVVAEPVGEVRPSSGKGTGEIGAAHKSFNTPVFWHLTDVELDRGYQTRCEGAYGNFTQAQCGSPEALLNSTAHFMHSVSRPNTPLFVVATGAFTGLLGAAPAEVVRSMQEVVAVVGGGLPGVPVVVQPGGRDFGDYGPDPYGRARVIYEGVAGLMRDWLTNEEHSRAAKLGYYSMRAPGVEGLTLLVMNTQLFSAHEPSVEDTTLAPLAVEQLDWLERELKRAGDAAQKVILVGHAAPGVGLGTGVGRAVVPSYLPMYARRLHSLVEQGRDVVLAMLAGAEHVDTVRVLRACEPESFPACAGAPVAPVLISPSVVPTSPAKNPAVRRYSLDATAGLRLANYEQFIADLARGNSMGLLQWRLEYTPTAHYGITGISARDIDGLVRALGGMEPGSRKLYAKYRTHYQASVAPQYAPPCIQACKAADLCNALYADSGAFAACLIHAGDDTPIPSE